LRSVDAKFDAEGEDLRDMYFLVGITLPNTGPFKLQGRVARRGGETTFNDLKVASGQSDVHGRISLDTEKDGRTLVRADLDSTLLRLADVGLRAAGRDPHPDAQPKLFSDVRLVTPAARRLDANGRYNIHRLVLSRVEVADVSAPFTIQHGRIKASPVTGNFMGGRIVLRLDADANQRPASARVEMTFNDLDLAKMPSKSEPPPYDGFLRVQIHAEGRGDSLHALAADANGTLSAQVARGAMRASLAELTGVDLRGLGLVMTGSHREVPVPCAAADFEIHTGVMDVVRFSIDSEIVAISGQGRVLLDPETLDLKLHGEPKGLHLMRLKAPVLVQGTMLQPKFSIDTTEARLQLVDLGARRSAACAG
jgi:AsmA family protein